MGDKDKPATSAASLSRMLADAQRDAMAPVRESGADELASAIYEAEPAITWFRARCEDKHLLTKEGQPASGERAWREALRADAEFEHTELVYDARFETAMVDGERLNDMTVMRLRERLADVYHAKCEHQRACLVIEQVARERCEVDPVVEYLDGLSARGPLSQSEDDSSSRELQESPEDGGGAIAELCQVLGAEGICAVYVRRWLIGAVARAKNPACKMDTCLVLSGPQGVGKSTLFQALVPDPAWAMEYRKPIGHADFEVDTSGPWIVDLSELSSARGREAEEIKAALSSTRDSYRPKYKALGVVRLRRFVFAGTTNRDAFLTDSTGNRRFWVVFVGRRRDPSSESRAGTPLDVARVAQIRDRVWSEALAAFEAGERWWLDAEEQAEADTQTREAEEAGPWDATIAEMVDSPKFAGQDFIGTEEIAKAIRGSASAVQARDRYVVSEAMQRLGWASVRRRRGGSKMRGWERPTPF